MTQETVTILCRIAATSDHLELSLKAENIHLSAQSR